MPKINKPGSRPATIEYDPTTAAMWDLEKETKTARAIQEDLADKTDALAHAVVNLEGEVTKLKDEIKGLREAIKELTDATNRKQEDE